MPVEIREMVVRAIVPAAEATSGSTHGEAAAGQSTLDHDRVVEACVAAVLKILEKRDRR